MQVKKQQLGLVPEQWTVSKLGKEYFKAVYYHLACLCVCASCSVVSDFLQPHGLYPQSMWITTNCRKFLKTWEYQTTWPAFWEICMQVKKQQLELYLEQKNGFKSGKE